MVYLIRISIGWNASLLFFNFNLSTLGAGFSNNLNSSVFLDFKSSV